ncbi:hypothetical protein ES703_72996 [subsurface metagenome]
MEKRDDICVRSPLYTENGKCASDSGHIVNIKLKPQILVVFTCKSLGKQFLESGFGIKRRFAVNLFVKIFRIVDFNF